VRLDQELAQLGAPPKGRQSSAKPKKGEDVPVVVSDSPAPSASAALRRVDRLALMHSVFVFLLGYLMPQHDPLDALFVERLHPDGRVLFDHFRGDVPLYLLRQAHGLRMARRPVDERFRSATARLLSGQLYGPLAVRPQNYLAPLYTSMWMAQRRVLARYERARHPLAADADMISGTALCFGPLLELAARDERRVNVSPLAGINTAPSALHPEGVDGCYSAQANNYAFEPQREHGFYEWRAGQQYYIRPSLAQDNTVATRTEVARSAPVHPVQDASLLPELDGADWADALELLPEGTPTALFLERLVTACEPGMERRALIARVVADVESGAFLAPSYDQWAGTEDQQEELWEDGRGPDRRARAVQRNQQYAALSAARHAALSRANAALATQCAHFFARPCKLLTAGDTSMGPTDRLVPPRAPGQHPEQHFVGAAAYVDAVVRGADLYSDHVRRAAVRAHADLQDALSAVDALLDGRRRAANLGRPE
jgi:hypothetical protein